MNGFRLLKADEIDCRIAMVKPSGVSLLLYKDARCDQNILDETVGCMNWSNSYSRDNANCVVEIWDDKKQQWISKENTGTESYTEKEKGLASDSFKRACFNWGIGRELYTAPFIWVKDATIKDGKCYDKFSVKEIGYDEKGRINHLVIFNDTLKRACFSFGQMPQGITHIEAKKIEKILKDNDIPVDYILENFGIQNLTQLPEKYIGCFETKIETIKEKAETWKQKRGLST